MSEPKFDRWMSDTQKFDHMKGKTVLRVEVTNDHTALLVLNDGTQWTFRVEGDCCSRSSFEDEKVWLELDGAIIQGIEHREGGQKDVGEYGDDLKWEFLVFITNKGHITIQHNNESNGYYSGYWIITGRE